MLWGGGYIPHIREAECIGIAEEGTEKQAGEGYGRNRLYERPVYAC